MAGKAIQNAHMDRLDKFGEDVIFDDIAEGMYIRDVVKKYGVGNRGFYSWLKRADRLEFASVKRQVFSKRRTSPTSHSKWRYLKDTSSPVSLHLAVAVNFPSLQLPSSLRCPFLYQ